MLLNYHIWDNVITYICFFESVYILFSKLPSLLVLNPIVATQKYALTIANFHTYTCHVWGIYIVCDLLIVLLFLRFAVAILFHEWQVAWNGVLLADTSEGYFTII